MLYVYGTLEQLEPHFEGVGAREVDAHAESDRHEHVDDERGGVRKWQKRHAHLFAELESARAGTH